MEGAREPAEEGGEERPRVVIYTDGGADPNPGTGGWGAVLLEPRTGRQRELSGGADHATNNRMELTAAIEALRALRRPSSVDLHTDSQYLRRGVSEWLPGWRARGFRRRTGELANVDLWQALAELSDRHAVRWHWVRGHAGDVHNSRADALATAAIRARRRAGAAPRADRPEAAEVFLRVSAAPGRGGWAALIRGGAEAVTIAGGEAGATANRLDLVGAAAALERLPPGTAVTVHTRSEYLRQGALRWLAAWERRGWRTRAGGPVRNADAWRRLQAALRERTVSWAEEPDLVAAEADALERAARDGAGAEPAGEVG